MKLSAILIHLLICTTLFGQNETLDKKAGFKNFVIGNPQSKYSTFLTNPAKQDDGTIWYRYNSDDSTNYSVFGKRFNLIILGFDQNQKLNIIQVIKEYDKNSYQKSLSEYSEVLTNLKNMFGSDITNLKDDKKAEIAYGWMGSKILMM